MAKGKIILRASGAECEKNLVGIIRILPEAEIILRELQFKTGLSLRTLASEIIVQASELIEIEHN